MVFNSLLFLLFFPCIVLLHYSFPHKSRVYLLLMASYLFYMCWNPAYIVLLLISTLSTYIGGLALDRTNNNNYRKLIVVMCLAINFSILFYYKYFNFCLSTVSLMLSKLGLSLRFVERDIMLPVGISFFTFQSLSYVIDVYRRTVRAEKSFAYFALFVSFFPQLVAGPIERSKKLLKELHKERVFLYENIQEGLLLMLWGYFLKLVIADRVAIIVDNVYDNYANCNGLQIILATCCFAIQIYCDFMGYSIIAKGAAQMVGVDIMDNFMAPYLNNSITGFWRDWHISLTTWFKDYLYIPLGGNKKGRLRNHINRMIVFCLSGLWHGANVTFIIWGGLNGIYQVIEQETVHIRTKISNLCFIDRSTIGHKVFQILFTNILICFSWIFFRSQNIREALGVIEKMIHETNFAQLFDGSLLNCGLDQKNFNLLIIAFLILLFADISKKRGNIIRKKIMEQNYIYRVMVYMITVLAILIFGVWGPGYDASGFIYFRF